MTSLEQHIQDFLKKHPASHGFVGFSGGIDSTALLLLLHDAGINVTAVHFQHGIRGDEAESDAKWCLDFCKQRKIDCHLIRLDVPKRRNQGESLEEAARRLRLQAWKTLWEESPRPIFLAHHADDSMEELFLRLARGSNCTGLTSLRESRCLDGMTFLRPLLTIRKEELRQYLLSCNIDDWRTDSTNSDSHYRRNAVRNHLLPLFNELFGTDAGLLQSLKVLKIDADYLELQAQKALSELKDIHSWQQLHEAILPRVFRLWRQQQDGVDEAPSRAFTQELAHLLRDFNGTPVSLQLNPSSIIRLSQRGIRLIPMTGSVVPDITYDWNWRLQSELHIPELGVTLSTHSNSQNVINPAWTPNDDCIEEHFSSASLPDHLTIRTWKAGDRMIPFGQSKSKKIQDIFTDAHIPRVKRGHYPVILADDTIIWIPGLRRAEFGRIHDDTEKTVLIRCIHSDNALFPMRGR